MDRGCLLCSEPHARSVPPAAGCGVHAVVTEDISQAWSRYILFAVYVVGISGGVRIWEMEKFITRAGPGENIVALNMDRWILEIYRTVISTLQSDAWMLLLFFVFALIAYVIVKGLELRRQANP